MDVSQDFAARLDQQDMLKDFRNKFFFPQHNGNDVIYLNGTPWACNQKV